MTKRAWMSIVVAGACCAALGATPECEAAPRQVQGEAGPDFEAPAAPLGVGLGAPDIGDAQSRTSADPPRESSAPGDRTRPPRIAPRSHPRGRRADIGRPGSVPLVRMVVPTREYAVGETVSVTVRIAGASDVGSVPFHVAYDPAVLRFQEGSEGPFLRSDGRETAFFASTTRSGDTVVVGLSRLGGGAGLDGEGELCVLRFTAIGAGPAGLAFRSAKVRDGANGIVSARFEAAELVAR